MPAAYWKARVHHHPAIVLRAAARRTLEARQSRTLLDERTPVRHAGTMTNLQKLKSELERERRSLAMLDPTATISKFEAVALIERCQRAIEAATTPSIG